MDPLSQGLLGASAAMALFHRPLGRGAAAVGAFAGVLADVDVFAGLFLGPVDALIYHRHVTHSLLFIPIGSLLGALPFFWIKAWRLRRKEVLGAAAVAYASHPLLDACTAYGTPLLWPISSQRFAFDAIAIVDPVFTLALLAGLTIGLWRERAAFVNVALIFISLYLALGLVQHERAMAAQQAIIDARHQQVTRRRVMPTLGNLVVWRSVYVADDEIFVDGLRLGAEPTFMVGESARRLTLDHWPDVEPDSAVGRSFERFEWFSDGYVGQVETPQGVVAGDLRYSMQLGTVAPIWAFAVEGEGDAARATIVEPTADRRGALKRLWGQIWSGDEFEPLPGPSTLEDPRVESQAFWHEMPLR